MPNIFVKTGGNFSGLTFQKVVAQDWALGTTISSGQGQATSTARFIPFTASEGGDCEGVFIPITIVANSASQTVAVSLQETLGTFTVTIASPGVFTKASHGMSNGDTVSLATTGALPTGLNATTIYFVKNVTTDTFELSLTSGGASINTSGTQSGTHTLWHDKRRISQTYDSFMNKTTTEHYRATIYKYIEWSSVYTIDTTASKYRIGVFSSDANCALNYLAASSTTYGYAVVVTGTTTYTASDNLFVKDGITITLDQSVTLTTLVQGSHSTIQWENPPISSYTFTVTNYWYPAFAIFKCGTSASRIPYAQQATISITNLRNMFTWNSDSANTFHIYGEIPSGLVTYLASNASSGQKVIVTQDDMSSTWTAGDSLAVFAGTSVAVRFDTIGSISGTSVTMTNNLTATHHSTYAVVNLTRCARYGVKLGAGISWNTVSIWRSFKLSGLNTQSFGFAWQWNYASSSQLVNAGSMALAEPYFIDNLFSTSGILSFQTNSFDTTQTVARYYAGSVVSNLYNVNTNSNTKILITTAVAYTISNLFAGTYVNTIQISANASTISNIHISTTWGGQSYYSLKLVLNASTLTTANIYSLRLDLEGVNNTLSNIKYNGGVGLGATNPIVGCVINNSSFGQTHANAYDFVPTPYFTQITTNNCLFNTSVNTSLLSSQTTGSFFKAHTHNQTSNDHRSWWNYGIIQSTGDGLTDTTVRTSGTGKFALRFQPLSSTDNLDWLFTIPTGNIQNLTMTVFMWVKINSATYYAGTHQKPRLTINYDNGTTAYAEATGSTDWQLLHVTFTPTTTYGQITVTVSGRTDATSTDAYFYIDDFGVSYPPNVALDLGGLDNWANGLPVTPPVSLPLSAGTVAQQVALNVPGQIKYIDGGEIPIY